MNGTLLHPSQVFHQWPVRDAHTLCEHYVNNLKDLKEALDYQKVLTRRVDITFDFEDGYTGVTLEDLAEILNSSENSKQRVGIRIPDAFNLSDWQFVVSDALDRCGEVLSYISIPKVEYAEYVQRVEDFVAGAIKAYHVRRIIPLRPIIENEVGVSNVENIAKVRTVRTLGLGILDFIHSHEGRIDLSIAEAPGQWEHALVRRAKEAISHAAALHGVTAIHNQTIDVMHPDLVYSDAVKARSLYGFQAQYSVHINQIRPIIDAMDPTPVKLHESEKILCLGQENEWRPIKFDGKLHGKPSYAFHWRKLKTAHQLGMKLGKEATARFFKGGSNE